MNTTKRLVLLGLGSNLERHTYITFALNALQERFGTLQISKVYESEPVGYSSNNNFYNLVVGFESDISVEELSVWTKQLERDTGRRPEDPKYGPRRLDIDILSVGDLDKPESGVELPRGEILTSAFVLKPLSELYPEVVHPTTGKKYRTLWTNFDNKEQRLWPIEFQWNHQSL